MDKILEKSLKVDSFDWFYREMETGENSNNTVVLLHGLPSHSYTWRHIMPALAKYNYRSIAPDWLGSGSSSKPSTREFAYTPSAYIAALDNFLSALDLGKISLVLQGFLGSVGIQYALKYPEKIARLVILNTPINKSAKLPWTMKQWGLPLVGEMSTQDPLLVDRTLEGGSGFVISDQDLAIYRQPFLKTSAVGRSLNAIIRNLKLTESMAEIETGLPKFEPPLQIIWGDGDPWLSLEGNPPDLINLPEAKHYPQEHWHKEIAPHLLNFLGRR
ncbi:MAG: Cis-3-alkyl-4-alkyloxetan-2-one decarboxylase [Chroococcopsis gigantea SAG 12.99]|jgi:pimeloyl-ACP methyl ester carboxylesterase|nr:alpha/beta fold hydrolase [Chlorogloea purpurea SAG 13.99]MDV2999927.1 Cis-3-alkyl-4-alkyloxetan-2-one decarboxylase [Chroococcopsis gigantea SAG 12.99]